jgi:GNAT superfamily N-acetyltransferase
MGNENAVTGITFYDLKWDSDFFNVNCAKAILHRALVQNEWNELKDKYKNYHFVSIENRNSEPINAQLIGKDSWAFLADVNIQFAKKLSERYERQESVEIYESLEPNEKVIDLAEFRFSKFIEDHELARRGGNQVYRQWIINSFSNPDKHYAISRDLQGEIDGFLLYSYKDNNCVIELIAVSKNVVKHGIGTSLFKALEYEAKQHGCNEIKVGTQIRNIEAINFYHKVGCIQVGCHQVFHLWNL